MVLAAVVGAGAGIAVAETSSTEYRAKAVLLVFSGARAADPGDASDATAQAETLATVIAGDDDLTRRVAGALGVSDGTAADAIRATSDQGQTALVRVSYDAATPGKAIAGARATARAATAPSATIPRGALTVVKEPRTAATTGGLSRGALAAIGAIAGLFIGIALFLGRERADPRIDDERVLASIAGCPATRLDRVSPLSVVAMAAEWQRRAGGPPTTVALIAATQGDEPAVAETADALRQVIAASAPHGPDGPRLGPEDLVLVPTPRSLRRPGRSVLSIDADLVVLVTRPGAGRVELQRTVALLGELAASPRWAVMVSPRRLRRLLRRSGREAGRDGASPPPGAEAGAASRTPEPTEVGQS